MKCSEAELEEGLAKLRKTLDIQEDVWARHPFQDMMTLRSGNVTPSDMVALAELERDFIESKGWKFGDWQNRPGVYSSHGCIRRRVAR